MQLGIMGRTVVAGAAKPNGGHGNPGFRDIIHLYSVINKGPLGTFCWGGYVDTVVVSLLR